MPGAELAQLPEGQSLSFRDQGRCRDANQQTFGVDSALLPSAAKEERGDSWEARVLQGVESFMAL